MHGVADDQLEKEEDAIDRQQDLAYVRHLKQHVARRPGTHLNPATLAQRHLWPINCVVCVCVGGCCVCIAAYHGERAPGLSVSSYVWQPRTQGQALDICSSVSGQTSPALCSRSWKERGLEEKEEKAWFGAGEKVKIGVESFADDVLSFAKAAADITFTPKYGQLINQDFLERIMNSTGLSITVIENTRVLSDS